MDLKDFKGYVIPADVCLTNVTDTLIGLHCNASWDTITCWPPTMAGEIVKQPCPFIFGAKENSSVYKTCGSDGRWTEPKLWSGFGHSDYNECIGLLFKVDKASLQHVRSCLFRNKIS